MRRLLGAVNDKAAIGIVRRNGHGYFIAQYDANTISAHPTRELRENFVSGLCANSEISTSGDENNLAFQLYMIVSAHKRAES